MTPITHTFSKQLALSTLLFALLCGKISAQRDVYNWQMGLDIGPAAFSNKLDLPKDLDLLSYGFRIDRRMGDGFTLGLHFTYLYSDYYAGVNSAGSLLSLSYYWDNGYLFSARSPVAIYHRLEYGYAEDPDQFDIDKVSAENLTLAFVNGLKFRTGDRFSLNLAYEFRSNKLYGNSLQRAYNVLKFGLNYHFAERRSTYSGPVFVPDQKYASVEVKSKSPEDLQKSATPPATSSMSPRISRSDSLAIFMYFDSLYERRQPLNEPFSTDSILYPEESFQGDTLFAMPDSLRGENLRKKLENDTLMLNPDTILTKPDSILPSPDSIPQIMRVSQPLIGDTVFRVDTVYIQREIPQGENEKKSGDESNEKSAEPSDDNRDNENNGKHRSGNKSSDSGERLESQERQIEQNQKDIERLKSNESSKDGKGKNGMGTLAAGAAGVAVGALAAKNKKHDADTIYYKNAGDQARIDSLEREVARLKQQIVQGSTAPPNVYVGGPPIGAYYASDTANADPQVADSLAGFESPDSLNAHTVIYPADSVNSITMHADSVDYRSGDTLTELLTTPDTTGNISTDAKLVHPDTSAANVLAEEAVVLAADSVDAGNDGVDTSERDTVPELSDETLSSAMRDFVDGKIISCTFELNSTRLSAADTTKLAELAELLSENDTISIELTGFTDRSGDPAYNLKLSQERAAAVADFLITRGVRKNSISIISAGVASQAGMYDKSARRVEIARKIP